MTHTKTYSYFPIDISQKIEYPSYARCNSSFSVMPKNYQHVLSMVFAMKEISENTEILSNVSLGFHIYDSFADARMTQQNTLKLLSTSEKLVPNFSYEKQKKLIAVIGGHDSEISLQMAIHLSIYKIPQVELMCS